MQEFWTKQASYYGQVQDLEEMQRKYVADFLSGKEGDLIEFACGNGKVISNIREAGFRGNILGIDYNKTMIDTARNRQPSEVFLEGDILDENITLPLETYDFVICLNSLHNLPDKEMIFSFFEKMKQYAKRGGYVIFDVRNSFNPGVNYGYYRNRKKGLQFHTLSPQKILKQFSEDFDLIADIGVTYSEVPHKKNFLHGAMYRVYLTLTRCKFFSPYRFFIFRKK